MKKLKKKQLKYILSILSIILVSISSLLYKENSQIENFQVHFIDVDQGDSILIRTPSNKNILIDSGSKKNSHLLFSYLNKQAIDKFDLVIATHPDEDHIGSMERIIKEYPIDTFYMPEKTHTTHSYQNMLIALKDKNINVKIAMANDKIEIDEDTTIYTLHPNKEVYKDNNAYSIVNKIIYKNHSFLLTGDIDKNVERKLVKEYGSFLKSDVLKLAHHGSASSSSKIFLSTVEPSSAIVSAGKNNDYSHPHKEVLQITKKLNIPLYRTDEQGTIIFNSDGINLSVNQSLPASYKYNKATK